MQLGHAPFAGVMMLMAVVLSGCTSGGTDGSDDAPSLGAYPPNLTVGDRWEYKVTQSQGGSSSLVMQVVATEATAQYGNRSVAATLVNVTRIDGKDGGHVFVQTIAQRSDLAQVRIDMTETAPDGEGNMTTTRASVYFESPCRMMPWPMQVGAALSSRCDLRTNWTAVPEHVLHLIDVDVEAYERVSVPAGTFDAFRLNTTLRIENGAPITEVKWWSPQACGLVRTEQRNALSTSTMDLVKVQCASPGAVRQLLTA